jgi:hypothetical protein
MRLHPYAVAALSRPGCGTSQPTARPSRVGAPTGAKTAGAVTRRCETASNRAQAIPARRRTPPRASRATHAPGDRISRCAFAPAFGAPRRALHRRRGSSPSRFCGMPPSTNTQAEDNASASGRSRARDGPRTTPNYPERAREGCRPALIRARFRRRRAAAARCAQRLGLRRQRRKFGYQTGSFLRRSRGGTDWFLRDLARRHHKYQRRARCRARATARDCRIRSQGYEARGRSCSRAHVARHTHSSTT